MKHIGAFIVLMVASYSVLPTCAYKLKQLIKKGTGPYRNKIFLTFDDGPSSDYTNAVLDLLKQLDIKASFFVIASFAEQNPSIIHRMQHEGHVIGLHSLEHKNGLFLSRKYVMEDFRQSLAVLEKLGVKPQFYRPPWGHFNLVSISLMKQYGLKPVLWDVMAQDWKANTTAKAIAQKIEVRTHDGDIICLHDGRGKNNAPERTLEALKIVLPILIDQGLRFDTVDHYDQ